VNGSGKWQLLLSFYMEIFIIFVLSFVLGLILTDLLKPIVLQQEWAWRVRLPWETVFSDIQRQLVFSVIFGLAITFLFCLVPVHKISRQSVRVVFTGLSEKVSRQRGRKIMLFIQMSVMLLFLSGTLIIQLQVKRVKDKIWHTLTVEERKNILSFQYSNDRMPGLFDIILQKLKQSSAIENVSFAATQLWSDGHVYTTDVDTHKEQYVRRYDVSGNFADLFNVKT